MDFKVDLEGIKQAKRGKQEMLARLKQIDFDSSGKISIDSFLAIATKYNLVLNASDLSALREQQKQGGAKQGKIEYAKVLSNIRMKIEADGSIRWVYSAKPTEHALYHIKIEHLTPNMREAMGSSMSR